MKQIGITIVLAIMVLINTNIAKAQDDGDKLKLSGELLTDQRFLLNKPHDWAWNENRLTLKLDKKIWGNSKFYSEVWLRNFGLPNINKSADLYNKGIVDPFDIEIREAYEMGLINKILPEQDFLNNLIKETEKFSKYKHCTIQQTKRLTSFSRKALDNYFEFEERILNL